MKSIKEIAAAMHAAWHAECLKQGMNHHHVAFKDLDPKLQACWVTAAERARTEIQACH